MVAQMENQIRHLKQTPEERSEELLNNAQESVRTAEARSEKINEAIDHVMGKQKQVIEEIQGSFNTLRKECEERQMQIEQEVTTMAD